MIWSLFSLFIFLVIAGEEAVEPVDSYAPIGNAVQEATEERQSTRPEEDCRYHEGPIPRRDLSDFVVDSERELESSDKKEIASEENETSLKVEESQVVEVELDSTSPNKEELDQ